ncbi:MAG: SDR family oxidoreductase [Myxococcales bacterium]|nr:SDR family oxidoreductase [Myxococcales bacterium]
MRFEGKTVVVTGAAAGIGRGYAAAFAAEGAQVVVADVDEAGSAETVEGIEKRGGAALAVRTDVSDEADASNLAARAAERFGAIDVLVNNAGLHLGIYNETSELPVAEWRRLFDVNVIGAMLCAKACRPHLRGRTSAILNQSSNSYSMGVGAYSVSKLALNGLTVSLAREFAGDGIRVNGIAPGFVETEAASAGLSDVQREMVMNGQLIKRTGQVSDPVATALFLCSDEARFVNGQTWIVDGGWSFRL